MLAICVENQRAKSTPTCLTLLECIFSFSSGLIKHAICENIYSIIYHFYDPDHNKIVIHDKTGRIN